MDSMDKEENGRLLGVVTGTAALQPVVCLDLRMGDAKEPVARRGRIAMK